jgi:hypothetical protein
MREAKEPGILRRGFFASVMTINGSADPVKTGNQILRAFAALHSEIPMTPCFNARFES